MGKTRQPVNPFKLQIENERKTRERGKEDPCPGCDMTVFDEEDFKGVQESLEGSTNVFKTSLKGPVKSIIIKGNPWILYTEQGFSGHPTLLEEGKYKRLTQFKIEEIGSAKKVDFCLADPFLLAFESSKFMGKGQGETEKEPWMKMGDRTMRQVAVGGAGVWGVAKDNSLWYRSNTAGNTESGVGNNWCKVQSAPIKRVSVGPNIVWCLDIENRVCVRTEVGTENPGGKNWAQVEGNYRDIAVSEKGHVWAVDLEQRIWWRKGAKTGTTLGTGWKSISGTLKNIYAGNCGIWGLDSKNQVWFRDGLAEDPDDNDGKDWTQVDGKFIDLAVGDDMVWGLAASREVFYRSDIDKNFGSHWLRIEQPKEHKKVFKQLDVVGDTLVASDKDNNLFYKVQATRDIKAGNLATLYDDVPNFDLYNVPNKGSSYKVASGGWVVYSEPNYQGKMLFQFGDECLSNDPVVPGEDQLKQWAGQFASARPIRGLSYRTLIMNIEPNWEKASLRFEKEEVGSVEHQNDSYETCDAPWEPNMTVNTSVSHHFTLNQPQNFAGYSSHLIQGHIFFIPPPEPVLFPVPDGPAVYSGKEFHRQLSNPFTLETEVESSKYSQTKTTAKLPKFILGKLKTTATVNIYKCTAQVPCKVSFKLGFLPAYEMGSEEWSDGGVLTSVDRTNVKVEISHENLNVVRKFSKYGNANGSMGL